jgi:hypothetical protein
MMNEASMKSLGASLRHGRGTMQPDCDLSEEQHRELADRANEQAREYYDFAALVRRGLDEDGDKQ